MQVLNKMAISATVYIENIAECAVVMHKIQSNSVRGNVSASDGSVGLDM